MQSTFVYTEWSTFVESTVGWGEVAEVELLFLAGAARIEGVAQNASKSAVAIGGARYMAELQKSKGYAGARKGEMVQKRRERREEEPVEMLDLFRVRFVGWMILRTTTRTGFLYIVCTVEKAELITNTIAIAGLILLSTTTTPHRNS